MFSKIMSAAEVLPKRVVLVINGSRGLRICHDLRVQTWPAVDGTTDWA